MNTRRIVGTESLSTLGTAVLTLTLLLSGCGGGSDGSDGAPGKSGLNTLASVAAEAPGGHCASGGSQISAGLDADGNGTLDVAEISNVQYVCNGAAGAGGAAGNAGVAGPAGPAGAAGSAGPASLVLLTAEAAGANCAAGGTKITAGADADGNGVLDPAEVTSTGYVCQGADGAAGATGPTGPVGPTGANGLNSLLAIVAEAAGANCTYGGSKVTSGQDANANGTLDPSEAGAPSYNCNGAPGPGITWTRVTSTSMQAQSNLGYLADNAGQVTITLPASPNLGESVAVTGVGAGGWKLAQNASQSIVVGNGASVKSLTPQWTTTSAGSAEWDPIAADSTGTNVYAASTARIAMSHDSGQTWTTSLAVADNWRSLSVSPDGQRVIAVSANGSIRVSIDAGANWSTLVSSPGGALERVAMSSNGQRILLARDLAPGSVYLSTDGGANFPPVAGLPAGGRWISASMSSDGQRMLATQSATLPGNATVMSTDGGNTWAPLAVPTGMHQTAISADGSTLVGITDQSFDNAVYVSKDAGVTWTQRFSVLPANGNLLRVAISDDASVMAASTFSGAVYVSTNGGADWVGSGLTRFWYGLSLAGNASKVFAASTSSGPLDMATFVNATSSQAGVGGFLAGGQYSTASLQYLGGDTWLLTNPNGTLFMK